MRVFVEKRKTEYHVYAVLNEKKHLLYRTLEDSKAYQFAKGYNAALADLAWGFIADEFVNIHGERAKWKK